MDTEIEPYKEGSEKFNVDKLQTLEPFYNTNLSQNNGLNNLYVDLVSILKRSTQEYYNMRLALGIEVA